MIFQRDTLKRLRLLDARILIVAWIAIAAPIAVAQSGRRDADRMADDRAVTNQLFGEDTFEQNAVEFIRRVRLLPENRQYDQLSNWVLPGQGHGFRIGGLITRPPGPSTDIADQDETNLAAFPEATWIHCPAREWVTQAVKLDRLGEMMQAVMAVPSTSTQPSFEQITLLTLIEVAQGDRDRVADRLAERFARTRTWEDENAEQQWWSDLIVLWAAAENPATTDLVIEDLFGAFNRLQEYTPNAKLDLIGDFLCLLRGQSVARAERAKQRTVGSSGWSSFDVFSRIDACSHARAAVLPRSRINENGVAKISGHEVDYFAHRVPLSGSYEVVAEVDSRAGAYGDLLVAGLAARPTWGLDQVSINGLAKGNWMEQLAPPIEAISSQCYLRAVKSPNGIDHYFNGRRIFTNTANESSAPWVAIESWRKAKCNISDFRISGDPVIPDSIDLLAGSRLDGWASYYDPEINLGMGNWKQATGEDGQSLLVSERSADAPGSFHEDLLYYVRPIVWDARISYEFEHRPGSCCVDPCFGRTVFRIRPSGVQLHRLTDGRFEQTALRPDNASPLDSASGSLAPPRLHEGWNRVELRILRDTVDVMLNGQHVAREKMKPYESRTFGLFHFRDQTRSVVRNVNLAGDWPGPIADPHDQPLTPRIVAQLEDASQRLNDEWHWDFKNGLPSDFLFVEGNGEFEQRSDGLHVDRNGDQNKASIKFGGIIEGDFEITLTFKDLKIGDQKPTWHCGLGMAVQIDNPDRTRLDMCLRRDRQNSLHHIAFSHNEVNRWGGINWISDMDRRDQSDSGRLRLVRRSNTVYGLFAAGDSKSFRPIGSVEVPAGRVSPRYFSMYSVAGDSMRVSGTWVNLSIRAEKLDRLIPDDERSVLKKLDGDRSKLPATVIDFAKQSFAESGLLNSTRNPDSLSSTTEGLMLDAVGGISASRVALDKYFSPSREIDFQADFEIQNADGKVTDGMSSEVVIGVPLSEIRTGKSDEERFEVTEATLITRYRADGLIELRPRLIRYRRSDRKTLYEPIRTRTIQPPTQLRIVLKDQTLYFLYKDASSPQQSIIATCPLDVPVEAKSASLWGIGSQNSGEMHVLLKSFKLYTTPSQPTLFGIPIPSFNTPDPR
ncbi:MAG: DUF1583 domain-containing protein [Planctomycetales bacterium]|nr:DUF1583 domain-containing protein [Planctomycetales bacterium]